MTTTQKTTDVTAPRRSHWWWTVPGCLAMVLLNAAISYGIVRLNAPVTAAFNMKQTVDAFFDSASQVQGAPDITREIQQDIARRMRAEP
ncbi:TrbI [Klebsiella pneumoniae]|uniref:TrbI F-type domain-containing protein n=1 Tax=Klebsiella pneumoniae TaxID=573 RepID=UPI000E2BF17B|nr:TrbI F-type domain-containing protein [Klebsiella pneumoniae]SWS23248.1 TrbI [Klebsiella pneumoniae]